jgi:SOS-response transcriptional repressor LexA
MRLADRILIYVARFIKKHGYSPSLREIRDGCKVSSISETRRHLTTLRSEKKVTWVPGKARTLRTIRCYDDLRS